jgi:hypothetical protein
MVGSAVRVDAHREGARGCGGQLIKPGDVAAAGFSRGQ